MGEKKRFLDRVLRFMGIEEEELAASEEIEVRDRPSPEPVTYSDIGPRAEGRPIQNASEQRPRIRSSVVTLRPLGFDDVQMIADKLIARTPVLMNVEQLDVATARRILDFLGGTTYALDGHIQPAGDSTFLLTPGGVEVDLNSLPPDASDEFVFKRLS